jgi:hypothetical protein
MREWPSILSIATAIVWTMAAYDDLKMGTQHRIPIRLRNEGLVHRYRWFRWLTRRVLLPHGRFVGWFVPLSMFATAIAYLSGVLVSVAAACALVLLAMMFTFLDLRRPRDDFVMLAIAQVVILVTSPGGLPAIAEAVESMV